MKPLRARHEEGRARRRGSARRTTPSGRRCSRRSCRAARSPTCSPRSATSTTSPSRTRRSPSRSSDDQETLATIHATVESTRGQTDTLRGRDAKPEAEARRPARRAEGRPGAAQGAREGDGPGARDPAERDVRELAKNKKDLARAIATTQKAQRQLAAKINGPRRPAVQARATSRRSYNGTLSWPMPGVVSTRSSAAARTGLRAAGNGCAHFHNGIDIVRPRAAARRSRPPAPGASSTSAGTTRTAPTRRGS